MTNQQRAQKIMEAYQREKEKSVWYDEECVSAAIRAMSDSFVYDDNGIAWFTADDFKKLAYELENLK